jgi:histidinol-phosphate/aromatic aminotransferase/cobyric acid decarboxylase-like protein
VSSPLRDFFQRSGAILIATSAAADFYVARDLKPFEEEEMMTLVAGSTLLKIRSLMKITGLAGLLVGTVVWAYGDFLFD